MCLLAYDPDLMYGPWMILAGSPVSWQFTEIWNISKLSGMTPIETLKPSQQMTEIVNLSITIGIWTWNPAGF